MWLFLVLALSNTCQPLFNGTTTSIPLSIHEAPALSSHPRQSIPIDFIASGDQCLGPIPVYALNHPAYEAESPASLAQSMSKDMSEYSSTHRFETCARFCRTSLNRWTAQLVTIGSQVSCVARPVVCPAGSVPSDYTIHSHPSGESVVLNPIDAVGWDEEAAVGLARFKGNQNEFSEQDLRHLPAFLVGPGGTVYFRESVDTEQQVVN